jgi:hypothetical protein
MWKQTSYVQKYWDWLRLFCVVCKFRKRKLPLDGHVASMGKTINIYRILNYPLGILFILKNQLKYQFGHKMNVAGSELSPVMIRVSRFRVMSKINSRSRWLRGLRRRSVAARLLELRVRIPSVVHMIFLF